MNAIQSSNSSSELAASVSGRKNAAMSNALSADSSSVSEASVIPSRTSAAASGAASSHVTSSEVLESVTSSSTGNNETNINHGSESIYELVLDGSCQFDRLPPLGKKIVRIFVSSTFSG
jgi:hypothetical protein